MLDVVLDNRSDAAVDVGWLGAFLSGCQSCWAGSAIWCDYYISAGRPAWAQIL